VERKTAGALTAELAELGAKAMVAVLADLEAHPAVTQPENGVTYASKIDKAEARLDFSKNAEAVKRQIRAFSPVPGAWFEFNDERYKVLKADGFSLAGNAGIVLDDQLTIACAQGAIRPTLIQRAGKPAMPLADFLRGNSIPKGSHLL
jgi:methionyl-tRNA formyltransferase